MLKNLFTAKKIALAAMFTALSFGVSYLQFAVFAAVPYLQLDFSFSVQLLGAYILGPVFGEMIVIAVQLLRFLTSGSGGVGEIANLVAGTCFVFVPSLIYQFKKGLPTVVLTLIFGTVLLTVASILTNLTLTFPLYFHEKAGEKFAFAFWYIVAFNLIKGVANSVITFLLYKRLKKMLAWFL